MRLLTWFALVAVWVAAIGCAKNPYQMRREYQTKQADRLRPAELERGGSAWRAMRTLRVRLYADPAAARKEGMREDFEQRLARANQVLESALRLRLSLEELRDLPAQPDSADGEALLLALEKQDAGADVDLIVAVIGASPVVTLSFHDLGRARVLGKHIVLRTMDDLGELRALEGFDTLDVEERSRLYQQRKRHKETTCLLHELGHVLGALHTRDGLDLMHPTYDNAMSSFAQPNLDLMAFALDERVAEASARDEAALYQRIVDYLEQSDFNGWIDGERGSQLANLEQALQQGAAKPAATALANTAAASSAQPKQEDLSTLSEPDRTRYLGVDQAVSDKRTADALKAMDELARGYPDSFPVQQKACQLGMQLGLDRRRLKGYCDRMLKLSMQPSP
jgi:hypothetical protein